ncbi:MAG: aspartyl protease family protein [Cytophagales bacterium]|nr:aspartyl protease family protein [Cytophagales bacterium]
MRKLFFACALLGFMSSYAQSPLTTTDFELYGDHIFVKVSVDDSEPLDFIFDTGDVLTVIDMDVAQKLNLPINHKETATSAQGSISGALIKHNKIQVNDLVLEKNIKVYATDLDHLEISIGRNIDGIVGYEMLHHHVVRLDYDAMKLELYDSGSYPKRGEELAFKFHHTVPTVEATIMLNNGESLSGSYYINTGAGTTVDFNTPFANANNIIDKTGEHYSYLVKGLGSKETRHYEGRVKSFTFGSNTVDNLPIGISQVTTGIQGEKKIAGIIGNRVMSRYNVLFDYKTHKIYLEKNGRSGEEYAVNCSGLDVQLNKDKSKVLIHQVFEGSQAASKGISVDDELVSINGESALGMGLPAVEKMLKKSGSSVTLTLNSGGSTKEVSLDLKSLL